MNAVLIRKTTAYRTVYSVFCVSKHRISTMAQKPCLRHLRIKDHLKAIDKTLDIPSFIHVNVIGCGKDHAVRSVYLRTSNSCYLFNCSEGTQRAATENKFGLAKLEHVFLTTNNWKSVGGLLGTCLTMEGVGVRKITLHGPSYVEQLLTRSKGFAQLHSMEVGVADVHDGCFKDHAMTIEYVPLSTDPLQFYSSRSSSPKSSHDNGERSPSPVHKKRRRSNELPSSYTRKGAHCDVMMYVCKPTQPQGHIDMGKCVTAGIERGPMVGKLQRGENVELPNGKIVTPADVMTPPPPPTKPFIILECPSTQYIPVLNNQPALQPLYAPESAASEDSESAESQVALVVHFTSASVVREEAYKTWMRRFGPGTKHLMVNELGSSLSIVAPYNLQAKLNMVHNSVFPLLPSQQPQMENGVTETQVLEGFPGLDVIPGHSCLKFWLRVPKQQDLEYKFDNEACLSINNEAYQQEAVSDGVDVMKALEEVKSSVHDLGEISGDQYPRVVFLGTGSSLPGKYRNVSSILLHLSESMCVLLDCGEDTLGQLWRHYGPQMGQDVLRHLAAVFISHLHADHHMGLIALVLERKRLLEEAGKEYTPLTIIAPRAMQDWFMEIDLHLMLFFKLVKLENIENFQTAFKNRRDQSAEDMLGMKEITAVRVDHAQFPHAVVLTHHSGWKLVYSGDTRPCVPLIKEGHGCDLLIHEATFDDGFAEEAFKKQHSTIGQAVEVGEQMEAKFTLLTHFSQRYSKMPYLPSTLPSNVGIAFDNMQVSLKELPLLPHLLPALQAMFYKEVTEAQQKSLKFQHKQKRAREKKTQELKDKLQAAAS